MREGKRTPSRLPKGVWLLLETVPWLARPDRSTECSVSRVYPELNKLSWTDKLWSLWAGRERTIAQAGQRYEYFVLAAVCWCCYDDAAARVAAITTAATTTPDGRAFMIKYLEVVGVLLDDDNRRIKVAELIKLGRPAFSNAEIAMSGLRLARIVLPRAYNEGALIPPDGLRTPDRSALNPIY